MLKKEEKEQKLLKMWLEHKYWGSCCEDEAIDWCNHSSKTLDTISEIADYVEWRKQLERVCKELSQLVQGRYYQELSTIF